MSQLQLEISNLHKQLACPINFTRRLLHALDTSATFPIKGSELSIAYVTDAIISKVHETFMDDPSPTDVITFPADEAMDSAGEIIISVDHARDKARELGEPFSHELSLYLVHGWLHLAGYDDRTETERSIMRNAEQKALSILEHPSVGYEFRLTTQQAT